MQDFSKWLHNKEADALRDVGKAEGRAFAYGEVSRRLDPTIHCQTCGREYWGSEKKDPSEHKCNGD